MILYDLYSVFVSFFGSSFFANYLIYVICLGLISALLYLLWHIIRGY